METHDLLLAVQVADGAVALALGPVAVCAERRPLHRSRAGSLYCWLVLAVALSALVLVALDVAAVS